MILVSDWVAQHTNTIGAGAINLAGHIEGYAPFSSIGNAGQVWYSIIDGANREAGIGLFNGTNSIARSDVLITLVNGVLSVNNPSPIDLSGTAVVACTFSAEAYRRLFSHLEDVNNPHHTEAFQVAYDPSQDFSFGAQNVQDAIHALVTAAHASLLEVPAPSVDGRYPYMRVANQISGVDSFGWELYIPPVVTTARVDLPGGTPGDQTGIGAAWTAYTPKPTDEIILAVYAGASYIKSGSGANDSDWVQTAAPIVYASSAEIIAGTSTAKNISPKGLADAAVSSLSATPANDANKYIRLGANGLLDSRLLDISPLAFKGTVNPSDPPPSGAVQGSLYFAANDALPNSGYGFPPNTVTTAGDALIYDGTKWYHLPNDNDLSNYLPLDGGSMRTKGATIAWPLATLGSPEVALDLNGHQIVNAIIDCGTF